MFDVYCASQDCSLRLFFFVSATVESLANLSLMSDRSTSYSSGKGIASETCSDLRDCRTASMQLPGGESSTLQGRVLIEELSSSTTRSEESICTPEHSMKVLRAGQLVEISKRGCKPGDVLHVVVKLPGVGGVQDVELEVSEVGHAYYSTERGGEQPP